MIVTGGAGFIGSHLVERLSELGHFVLILDNLSTGRIENIKHLFDKKNIRFEKIDVSRFEKIQNYFKYIDWVFHLAAIADIVPSIKRPYDYHRANVESTISVLEASRLNKIKRFLFSASSSCYGIPKVYPTPEDAEILPQYPYAFTKFVAEQYCLFWAKIYKLPVISLRLFNVFGPRARTSGAYGAVIGVFLAQKLAGHPYTVVGDGNQRRDFIYVTDVVEAFIKAAESEISGEIFNVGTSVPQSINTLVELLGGEKIYIPKRPGEPECTWADITKIRQRLGWQPTVSFKEGIDLLLRDLDYWKDAPLWTPEKISEATKDWFRYLGGSQD